MTLFDAVLQALERGVDVTFRTDVGRDVVIEARQVVWDPKKQDTGRLTSTQFVIDAVAHLLARRPGGPAGPDGADGCR